jgi:tRNA A37 threonylcarbamoyladenosine modification protein TsaB
MASGRRVVAVPALEAFASSMAVPDGQVAVWMDAQRQQIFAAIYDKAGGDLSRVQAPVSWTPERVAEEWGARHAVQVLIGDGMDLYKDHARAAWPAAELVTPAPPLAPIAATLAARGAYPAVAPHAIVPIYVRASDAEISRLGTGGPSGA